MTLVSKQLSLTINDKPVGPIDVPEAMMMQDFLHEYLNLTGSRMGCGQGICHACTVIVEQEDGSLGEMRTCITGAHWFADKRLRTVEGHARRDASGAIMELSPVQQSFIEHFAFQCGYCTPGFVTAATVLMDQLKRKPVPRAELDQAITDGLGKHICRCTGYVRYFEAVRDLALKTPGLVKA
ncbi:MULTISPECIES: (2Fe-2S)-binding protein [unclassified Mesorhizobium]|uniref:(2Fe-2S)-binding protein n=1 Tax=unclassified Mesorhizobium TaxID=325217 RepID=UPI001127F4DE|nr:MULTISPECIES: (2Fe-2S)-binding protein [unclassified Mesorhizobium]TPI09402.1 (2Fe-2S)-binding protein [Mesorhizobium sp. B4-1-1]TPL32923.1 (2Fe-2S)-binding protein [Mesorhizobium sp. B2-4-6]